VSDDLRVHLFEAISHVDKELLAEHVEDTENHQMLQRSHQPEDVLSETQTVSTSINHNNLDRLTVSLQRMIVQQEIIEVFQVRTYKI